MKVFISHSAKDNELVEAFADLLKLGMGLPHSAIFYSSQSGSIPNGQFFVQHILKRVNEANLILAVLSPSYFQSRFCLAEAGAALARQSAGNVVFNSYLLPPLSFADLDGALYGIQSGFMNDPNTLSELRDRVVKELSNSPSTAVWRQKEKGFLAAAAPTLARYQAEDDLSRIEVRDVFVDRTADEKITFKSKLRIVLRNNSERKFSAGPAQWDPLRGIELQAGGGAFLWQLRVKVKGKYVWSDEAPTVIVPPQGEFRTWIGLGESVTDREVLQRSACRTLGQLALTSQTQTEQVRVIAL